MSTVDIGLQGTQHIRRDQLIRELLEQNKNVILNGELNNAICFDGIVDDRQYSRSKYPVAFLLKETNGNTSDGKKPDHYTDWDYVEWIRESQSKAEEPLYPTFRNISMWTSIYFDLLEKGEASKEKYLTNGVLQVTDSLRKALRRIAVINLKKTFGGGSTKWEDMEEYLNQDVRGVLREQLYIAAPSVVLCGGDAVFDWARQLFDGFEVTVQTAATEGGRMVQYFTMRETVFVRFYHPACRKSREAMFDYAEDVLKTVIGIL